MNERHPPLIPPLDRVSFSAFAEVFGRRPVLTWIWNSTLVVAGSTALSLVISALAGYSLSRFHTPAQKIAGAALLLTKMLPGTAFGACGEGFVRCAYATNLDNIKEALARLKRFISRR